MKKNLKSNLVVAVVLILESKAGIEITAPFLQTMSGLIAELTSQPFVVPVSDVDRSNLIVLKMN